MIWGWKMFEPVKIEIAYNDDMEYFSRSLYNGVNGYKSTDVGFLPGSVSDKTLGRNQFLTKTEIYNILNKMANKNIKFITDEEKSKKYIEFGDEESYTEFMIIK